jgi:hypothetical protein
VDKFHADGRIDKPIKVGGKLKSTPFGLQSNLHPVVDEGPNNALKLTKI